MKNKASKMCNGLPGNGSYEECKILIEKSETEKNKFDIHIYLEGVLEKVLIGVPHYHIQSTFGDDAE